MAARHALIRTLGSSGTVLVVRGWTILIAGCALAASASCSVAPMTPSTGSPSDSRPPWSTSTAAVPPPTTVTPTTATRTPASVESTTTTLIAVPAGACEAAGYLPFDVGSQLQPEQTKADFNEVVYEPDPSRSPDAVQRPFDWNLDGRPDRVVVEAEGIRIDFGSGAVRVTGVRTDFRALHPYETIHGRVPVDIGDVTGDGAPDLLVTTRQRLGVLVGHGRGETARTVAFDSIADKGGWIVEPRNTGVLAQDFPVPTETAEPHVAADLNGDGINDIVVWSHGSRSSGLKQYTIGRPCAPRTP